MADGKDINLFPIIALTALDNVTGEITSFTKHEKEGRNKTNCDV